MRQTVKDEPSPDSPTERRRSADREALAFRTLIVDDDSTYLHYLSTVLKRIGIEVLIASDGAEALEKLRDVPCELVIVDLRMPRLDGFCMIDAIRAKRETRDMFAILLTADEAQATEVKALEKGFDDYLPKSSTAPVIVAKVNAYRRIIVRQRMLEHTNRDLLDSASTDPLTRLPNRRFFFQHVDQQFETGHPILNIVLFDLNKFKRINDTHGHQAGDLVLAGVASVFRNHTRFGDVIARFGGDEFIMLISGTTRSEAASIATRLCVQIGQLRWTLGAETASIGVSMGLASSEEHPEASFAELVHFCDQELYRMKNDSRRKWSSEGVSSVLPPGRIPRAARVRTFEVRQRSASPNKPTARIHPSRAQREPE